MEEVLGTITTDGAEVGSLDDGSSDLEFGQEAAATNAQLTGMRFTNITIPKGAKITNAYIQFTVDAINKNTSPCDLTLVGEAADNAVTFDPSIPFNLTSRPKTTAKTDFSFTSGWSTTGSAGVDERTGDISAVIQEIIDRAGWERGNSLALYISGTGVREAESFDGSPSQAPNLVVEYLVPIAVSSRISAGSDDMEEYLETAPLTETDTPGSMDDGSSDLELGFADPGENAQLVGMRFQNINVPQGAMIKSAYIQFTVDATGKNTDPSNLSVVGEAVDNALTFDSQTLFNLSSRPKTTAKTDFSFTSGWSVVGSAGVDERTGDLSAVIQEIVNRPGWANGNALALYISGEGVREAESFDGSAGQAPNLVIEYYGTADVQADPNPLTSFPIAKGSSWSYFDGGVLPAANWMMNSYQDDKDWKYGVAYLGYGDSDIKTNLSFGSDAGNKFTTAYYIKRFTVANPEVLAQNLQLSLGVDDGAIVYLNGQEISRFNMPVGVVSNTTFAASKVDGTDETAYQVYTIPSSLLQAGENMLAVEVHQDSPNSSDTRFDLELVEKLADIIANPVAMGCEDGLEHIACFTSLLPSAQVQSMVLPSSHDFQIIFSEGDIYSADGTAARGNNDFTGYIPFSKGDSEKGHLAINHETNPGGVSMLDIHYDAATENWMIDASAPVDFSAPSIMKTERNCSGGVTPWGTVITSEETMATSPITPDGYYAVGWHVEIDPKTRMIKEYGNGKPEKLWAMGRISHENIVVADDSLTAYYGEDASSGNMFKFVADNKMDLSKGTLYVLKLDGNLSNNEPTSSIGTWVVVPNSTVEDCNNTKSVALALGGTRFNGVEDAEISPLDGKIYFTAKGNSRTYRFKDDGMGVSEFETFVGGQTYSINYGTGIAQEAWGSGNDNLTFDDKGNLWVLQDGGRNHIWLVRPDHTQASPKVELFMKTPLGSEPTGMTFSPDHKFMFLSIQTPNTSNSTAQMDAQGRSVVFNKSTTLVVARKENLDGQNVITSLSENNTNETRLSVYPNPTAGAFTVKFNMLASGEVKLSMTDLAGRVVTSESLNFRQGENLVYLKKPEQGTYLVKVSTGEKTYTQKVVVK